MVQRIQAESIEPATGLPYTVTNEELFQRALYLYLGFNQLKRRVWIYWGPNARAAKHAIRFTRRGEIFDINHGEQLLTLLESCLEIDLPAEGLVLC